MKKHPTSSFVLTLKLNTTDKDFYMLDKRFYYAFLMKNRLIRHVKKALSSMRQDKMYRALMKEWLQIKDKTDPVSKHHKAETGNSLSEIRLSYGLSEY